MDRFDTPSHETFVYKMGSLKWKAAVTFILVDGGFVNDDPADDKLHPPRKRDRVGISPFDTPWIDTVSTHENNPQNMMG